MDKWNRRLARWFSRKVFNIPEGEYLSGPALIISVILQPARHLLWKMNENEGYDVMRDVWHIEGLDFSGELMRHFGYGDDRLFKIIERKDKAVTIQWITDGETP